MLPRERPISFLSFLRKAAPNTLPVEMAIWRHPGTVGKLAVQLGAVVTSYSHLTITNGLPNQRFGIAFMSPDLAFPLAAIWIAPLDALTVEL